MHIERNLILGFLVGWQAISPKRENNIDIHPPQRRRGRIREKPQLRDFCEALFRSARIFHQQGYALAASDARAGYAVTQICAAQFARHRNGETDAGGRQGMANGDRSAVDVELVAVEAEFALDS